MQLDEACNVKVSEISDQIVGSEAYRTEEVKVKDEPNREIMTKISNYVPVNFDCMQSLLL